MQFGRARLVLLLAATAGAQAFGQTPGQAASTASDIVPNTMEARVQACVGCHGKQGSGVENVYFPRLAGKPAGYLYNQLVAFRDGRRKYVPMNYLLAYLPDPYLARMADYFAQLNPPFNVVPAQPATPQAQQRLKDGQRIVTGGIPAKKVPACVTCHGAELNGREPGIPGLLGLRGDYITAQLGAWRYGIRTALAPDCMQFIASSLTEHEVGAVAAWLASLPVPPNLRPAKAGEVRLPLACGSQHGQQAR
jgi:cytochrome c553